MHHNLVCRPAGLNSDYVIVVEHDGVEEELKVHRMLLEARSPFFKGMLESNMSEAQRGRFVVRDMLPPVVKAVLYFIYTGQQDGKKFILCIDNMDILPATILAG